MNRPRPMVGAPLDVGRRWVSRIRSDLPLVVLSVACGLGLYWAAVQLGWLAVGWRPAGAATFLYLAGVAALAGALSGGAVLEQRLLDRLLPGGAPPAGARAGGGRGGDAPGGRPDVLY